MSINILKKTDLKSIVSVGLDVSKAKIDICLVSDKQKDTYLRIKNTKEGIIELIKNLKASNLSLNCPLVIESTGDYNTLACILFSEAGLNIKEINPIMTKNYVKSTIRGTKTDKTDAKALANIGLINKDNLFTFNKSKEFITINKKISLVSNLEKQMQTLKMTINSFKNVSSELELSESKSVKNIEKTIKDLEKQMRKLQKEIEVDSIGKGGDNEDIERIATIKGVSKYMAKVFYVGFAHKKFESKEAMHAFVGFEPKLRESGNMQGKARISKRGNPYMRKKLFQSASMGILHSEFLNNIYKRAKDKGKHHYICISCVVKKIIHIMYSMLKHKTVFSPESYT